MNKTSQLKSLKTELSNRLRWEEDGGRIMETNTSISDRHFFLQPMRINTGMHHASFQWNEKYRVESLQAGTGTGWTKKKARNEK